MDFSYYKSKVVKHDCMIALQCLVLYMQCTSSANKFLF
jgi:hypothetical protein